MKGKANNPRNGIKKQRKRIKGKDQRLTSIDSQELGALGLSHTIASGDDKNYFLCHFILFFCNNVNINNNIIINNIKKMIALGSWKGVCTR